MNRIEHIEISPQVMLGKPVIKRTRITAEAILEELAAGYSIEQVWEAHPRLAEAQVLAALQYATAIRPH